MMINELKSKGIKLNNIEEIRMIITSVKGGASGGTLASVINLFETLTWEESIELMNPYYLNPKDDNNNIIKPSCDVKYHQSANDC